MWSVYLQCPTVYIMRGDGCGLGIYNVATVYLMRAVGYGLCIFTMSLQCT